MIIDINMHWLPPDLLTDKELLDSYIRIVPRAYGEIARVDLIPGTNKKQIIIEKPAGHENLNFGPEHINPKSRIEVMDEAKVDKAILRVPCWNEWLTLEMCRNVNNGMAEYAKRNSDRFHTLGVVPPWGDKESMYEMERCVKELGCVGIEASAHYGKLYLDAKEFRPYFKKVSDLGVPVCVHHTPLPVQYESIVFQANLRRLFGRCVDQATAVGREIFSDLFEEVPDLKLVHSMLGGGFFAFADLLAPKGSGVKEEMERFDMSASEKARKYLNRNLYFGISHAPVWGKAQIECAIKVLGADHVLFGGSYPVRREWLLKGVDYVQSLDVGEKEKAMVLGENAKKIFRLN